jgi:hypothetical protein
VSDAAEAAPAESAPAESSESTSTPAPAQGSASASEFFELEDGQKWTVEDLKKNWNKVQTNYRKGASAAQLLTKADQRIRQAQEYEQRYRPEALKERLSKDAGSFFKELGLDPTDFATNLLMPEIEKQQMTAEQRAMADKERAVAEREARIQKWEQEQQRLKYEDEVKRHQETYRKTFSDALAKAGFSDKNAHVMRRMAAYMDTFVGAEEEPSPEQVAQFVRDDIANELRTLTDSLDGRSIVELFGPDLIKKIRAHDLAQLRSRQPGAQAKTTPPNPAVLNGAVQPKPKYLTEAERDKELQRRIQALNMGEG